MAVIATISSSPSTTSRTEGVLAHLGRRVQRAGHVVSPIILRDLPAEPLLRADSDDDEIAAASCALQRADAVIVSTPVYKAAYSGLLKAFLDLLPQTALRDKVVLPIATGGSPAHVLAVDYALRPVLASLAPSAITPGWFVLASEVTRHEHGEVTLAESAVTPLAEVTRVFLDAVAGRSLLTASDEAHRGELFVRSEAVA